MSYDLKIETGDLKINNDGSIKIVRDNEKLSQDIVKAILTAIGSNKYFPWYGSTIGNLTIGEIIDNSMIDILIKRSISNTLNNLVSLQRTQSREQYVSAGETIATIQNIDVIRSDSDPRQIQISVVVLTRKMTLIEETFTLNI